MLPIDALAQTAVGCIDVSLPFKAHLSSVTYPGALAAAVYFCRDGINNFLKDINREF